jgi:hypothetical protein
MAAHLTEAYKPLLASYFNTPVSKNYNYGSLDYNDNIINYIVDKLIKLDFNMCYYMRGNFVRNNNVIGRNIVNKINNKSKTIKASLVIGDRLVNKLGTYATYVRLFEIATNRIYEIGITSTNATLLNVKE